MATNINQGQIYQPCNIHRKTTVIAHRGNCSIFPQNTKEAIIAGIHSSDLTELDVHLTKDDQVIVFHDRYLSRTTDIEDHLQFSSRLKEEIIDDYQQRRNDWWVREFTLEQLRTLKVFQPVKYRPQFDFMRFEISTLEEIIEQCLAITNKEVHKNKLKSGILIELKEQIATQVTERDIRMCKKVVEILKKFDLNTLKGCQINNLSIVIQSFNIPLLSYLQGCENWLIQLYDKDEIITEEMLCKNRIQNVKGIGITQKNLLNQQGKPEKRVGQICKKLNYALFYWTIRDDDLNSKPFECKTYRQVYLKLAELGVTGFITEFPDKCKGILGIQSVMYDKGNLETDKTEDKCQNQKETKMSNCESTDSTNQQNNQI